MYRLRLNAVFGGQRLNQISRQQIQTFHTSLKNEGLSASTCNHYVKLIKHSLNLAIDWDMLEITLKALLQEFIRRGGTNSDTQLRHEPIQLINHSRCLTDVPITMGSNIDDKMRHKSAKNQSAL